MLDSILDDICIALLFRGSREALDTTDGVIYEVIDKILIDDLLFIDNLSGEADDDLGLIDEARLHHLGQLGNQGLLFEQEIVRALLRVDQDPSHGLEEVVEDLLEVGRLVEHCRGGENVTIENLQEKLHIAG